jgi:hypothetical protein
MSDGEFDAGRALSMSWTRILAAGAIAALACGQMACAPDDEPTIRVRNGSMSFEIVGGNKRWQEIGTGGLVWRFNSGVRRNPHYSVDIQAAAGVCKGNPTAQGSTLVVTYSDETTVTARIDAQRKTRLESTRPLTADQGGRVLRYAPAGHIRRIVVGQTSCEFAEAAQLQEALAQDP